MLRDVVLHGTAVAAGRLKYAVAGKTGTTHDFTDAWFIGFSPSITCGVWVGFDEKKTLGDKETGARAALPIWMDFMATALPQHEFRRDFPQEDTYQATGQLDSGTHSVSLVQHAGNTIETHPFQ
jgi:membrane carboxypeptidase/penicillin-binding protein